MFIISKLRNGMVGKKLKEKVNNINEQIQEGYF